MRKRRVPDHSNDLDINSLLDILVILLVFLLKSYSSSELEVSLPKGLALPVSKSRAYGEIAPTIKVTKNKEVWVGKEKVVDKFSTDSEGKIPELYNGLTKVLEKDKFNEKGEEKKDRIANLVFDKEISYNEMKAVMHTAALSGIGKFKFLLKAEE